MAKRHGIHPRVVLVIVEERFYAVGCLSRVGFFLRTQSAVACLADEDGFQQRAKCPERLTIADSDVIVDRLSFIIS